MDRRSFLRRVGLGGAALVVAPKALEGLLDEAPTAEEGIRDVLVSPKWSLICSEALVASGGLCPPVSPYYFLDTVGESRPVRAALPSFKASRGGVSSEIADA